MAESWNAAHRPQEERYPDRLHGAFQHLMVKFDIAYQAAARHPHDEPQMLIAQLVDSPRPNDRLAEMWHGYGDGLDERVQVCEIQDPDTGKAVTPTGMMYQLIVRFHP